MPKFKIDDNVRLTHELTLTITKIDQFGATPHYGFLLHIQPVGISGHYESGWIPVSILDAIGNLA